MQSYEVEIKSLLGSSERAQEIRNALKEIDPQTRLTSKNKQLNHYFEGGSLEKLAALFSEPLPNAGVKQFSVRTRDKDGTVYIVAKVSIGDDSSSNGVARREFETIVPFTLDELDKKVLDAGFKYQAKWSREREEYLCRGVNVTLDKNAGYGWLAEFELVVDDESKVAEASHTVRNLMQALMVGELPQDRLERMFAFYNEHWQEYYGTEKVFMVE